MCEMILDIRHLSKAFGSHQVLRDIDFSVYKGDVISVIGASGSGKSTLLRCINLLETPNSGEICYQGRNVLDGSVKPHSYRAKVGMVFQSFNLFNNMTVLENCMVGQQQVFVTPWGKPALGYKTRNKKARTNKFIVKRRNDR